MLTSGCCAISAGSNYEPGRREGQRPERARGDKPSTALTGTKAPGLARLHAAAMAKMLRWHCAGPLPVLRRPKDFRGEGCSAKASGVPK